MGLVCRQGCLFLPADVKVLAGVFVFAPVLVPLHWRAGLHGAVLPLKNDAAFEVVEVVSYMNICVCTVLKKP